MDYVEPTFAHFYRNPKYSSNVATCKKSTPFLFFFFFKCRLQQERQYTALHSLTVQAR